MRKSIVVLCILIAGAVTVSAIYAPTLGEMFKPLLDNFVHVDGEATYTDSAGNTVTKKTLITGKIDGFDGDLFLDGAFGHVGAEVLHLPIITAANSAAIRTALAHPTITFATGCTIGVVIVQ